MTLLHFIALTVKEKYPELANFWHELHFVEKAAAGEGSPLRTIPGGGAGAAPGPLVAFVIFFLTTKTTSRGNSRESEPPSGLK